jgi:hypothetical protein
VRVYVLEFDRPETLARAFELVLESDRSTSCTAEAERRRLRFVTPDLRADALIERIYLEGGLTWCSRHPTASRD